MTVGVSSTLRVADVERRSGWRVVALATTSSTNDDAARERTAGATDRVAVVADRQTAGRGREDRSFSSPYGGLYVSLIVSVRADDLPAPLVMAIAIAVADAIEDAVPAVSEGTGVQVKWPNDVWIHRRKVAGILLDARPATGDDVPASISVVVGIGVNVSAVPDDLPHAVAAATTALDRHATAPVAREDLLVALLARVDGRLAALRTPRGRVEVEADYRRRAALLGEPVRFHAGNEALRGVLEDVSMDRGILVRDGGTRAWWPAAHVRDVRWDTP